MNDNPGKNIDNAKPEGINILANPEKWRKSQMLGGIQPEVTSRASQDRAEAVRLVASMGFISLETQIEVVQLAETVRKYIVEGVIELPPATPPALR